jgi:p24 family protein alpha
MHLNPVFILFFSVLGYANALYFHIGETERKCFIEEIPDETTVIGKQKGHSIG